MPLKKPRDAYAATLNYNFLNLFTESPVNMLTNPVVDPTGKIPEYKVCAVKLEAA